MRYRSPWLPFYTTVWLGLATPAGGQTTRQVSLNTATGQIDRRYLPADQPFDFLIRASSELREFRGEYRSSTDTSATVPVPWLRRDGTKSNDATLRINDLRA